MPMESWPAAISPTCSLIMESCRKSGRALSASSFPESVSFTPPCER